MLESQRIEDEQAAYNAAAAVVISSESSAERNTGLFHGLAREGVDMTQHPTGAVAIFARSESEGEAEINAGMNDTGDSCAIDDVTVGYFVVQKMLYIRKVNTALN